MHNGLPQNYNIYLVNTRVRGKYRFFEKTPISMNELCRALLIICSLSYQLIRHHPNVVHLNCSLSPIGIFRDLLCAYIIRIWKVPLVSHYRGNIIDFPGDNIFGFSWWALYRLINISQVNVALNEPSLKYLSHINKNRKCIKLPNFISDEVFKVKPSNHNVHSLKRVRILFVGGIANAKGFLEIVKAARSLPEADFDLIGNYTNNLESMLNSLPSNVNLLGVMNNSKVLKEMHSSDLFFFPTHSEGFPNVLLESMAAGLPVVSTRTGAIPEMIENGKGGYLFEKGDAEGFVNALKTLIKDPVLRTKMGKFNRQKCKSQYAYSVVTRRLVEIYNQISG